MSGTGSGRSGERLRAIVLRRTDYAEADRVLQLLTPKMPKDEPKTKKNVAIKPKLKRKILFQKPR